jgi:hypothetical protein
MHVEVAHARCHECKVRPDYARSNDMHIYVDGRRFVFVEYKKVCAKVLLDVIGDGWEVPYWCGQTRHIILMHCFVTIDKQIHRVRFGNSN